MTIKHPLCFLIVTLYCGIALSQKPVVVEHKRKDVIHESKKSIV